MNWRFIFLPLKILLEKYILPPYNLQKARALLPLLPERSLLLDVGCGKGEVSYYLKKFKPSLKIVGLEVRATEDSYIPMVIYDGRKIPFQDNSFDGILLLDVLHHVRDITSLLRECKRVSKWIIILEHPCFSWFSRPLLMGGDLLFNLPFSSPTSLNFKRVEEWKQIFSESGFNIEFEIKNLYLGGRINKRYNFLVKLRRR